MRIAISSTGPEETSPVDSRFGRAPWLFVFDTESGETTTIDNTENAQGRSGVGVTTAQRVVDAGADVVLTGRLGPNAERVLSTAGIQMVLGAEGSVREALTAFRERNAQ